MTHNPDPVDVHVGMRVRTLRKSKKMSQTALAGELGLTFQQIQTYERGYNRVSSSVLYRISKSLGEPISYFFDGLEGTETGGASQIDATASAALVRVPAIRFIERLSPKECSALDGIITSMVGDR